MTELPEPLFWETTGGKAAMEGAGGGRKHSQKPADALMICPNCKNGKCEGCVDKVRLILRDDPICTCKKSGHSDAVNGEARLRQIRDPETSDVYGPGLVVTQDGDVNAI